MPKIFFCLFVLIFATCKTPEITPPPLPENYVETIETWRAERMAELLSPNGWLSLIGLYWLKEGSNYCGSHSDADVILPSPAPDLAVTYTLSEGRVTCEPNPHAEKLLIDADGCEFAYGSLRWQLLERGGRHGVRVRDTLRPAQIRMRPIEYFPIDAAYRVAAAWQPATGPDSLLMRNVLDMEYYIPVLGKLRFTLAERQHELIALDGGPDDLFLIFADKTTGETTYGGGRYLYCPRPDADGRTVIDFNKAYNPPCAFTDYATCLLPRIENHLPVAVPVGEKSYGDH